MPAGPRRHLLDAAGDDRAQPERLWLDRPEHGRQGPAARLLLRLSDRLARPGHEQRPQRRPRRSAPREVQFARFAGVCRTFAPIYRQMTLGAVAAFAAGGDISAAGDARLWRRRAPPGAIISRPGTRAGPFVLIGHSQGSADAAAADRPRDRDQPRRRGADEARDPPRLQRAGAAGQAGRRDVQEDAAVQPPGRDRLRHHLDQLPREERPAAGAMFGYRRPAGHDRRLRQSGAARRARTGCRSTAIGTRARSLPVPGGPISWSSEGAAADALSCAPRASSRPSASTTASAAICRSAPTPTPATSAPTASAARSACWACSSPAGACTLPTCTRRRAT